MSERKDVSFQTMFFRGVKSFGKPSHCLMRRCNSINFIFLSAGFKKKKKVNSSNSGQKIVACQAAELPGFHVTLETSTGAPASEQEKVRLCPIPLTCLVDPLHQSPASG